MMPDARILMVGNFAKALCDSLQQLPGVSLTCLTGTSASPLFGRKTLPHILVLEYGDNWQAVLTELTAIPLNVRPVVVAILPGEDISLLHHAMRSGARDYLVHPVKPADLNASVQKLWQEIAPKPTTVSSQTIALLSCNSSLEAAFLSGNLAHIMALVMRRTTTVIDFDLQFSSLPLFMDITVEHSFSQALAAADTLDEAAVDAYLSKHVPGLSLLGSRADEIVLPGEVSLEKASKVINTISRVADCTILNLPQLIDPLTSLAIEQADTTLLVVGQSLGSLNYGKGLLNILRNELEVPPDKLRLVVNHYHKPAQIRVEDISKTLGMTPSTLLPHDTRTGDNERYGIPLLGSARQSPLTRELIQLAESLVNPSAPRKTSFLARLFSSHGGNTA